MPEKYIDTLPVQIVAYRQVEETVDTSPQQWLRISTAGKMRDIKQHTIRNWIGLGKLPVLALDGVFFITLDDLDKYVDSRKGQQMSGSRHYKGTSLPD